MSGVYYKKIGLLSKGLLELGGELLLGRLLGLHFIDGFEDLVLPCLNHHTSLNDLIENVVDLLHVKDQVKLADVLEAGIQALDEGLDQIQDSELRLRGINDEDEVEGSIMAVDDLGAYR